MIDELGILPQSSIKRTRQSRATLVESAMKPPIRGTSCAEYRTFMRRHSLTRMLHRAQALPFKGRVGWGWCCTFR